MHRSEHSSSFDHLVGEREPLRGHIEARCVRGLQVNDQSGPPT